MTFQFCDTMDDLLNVYFKDFHIEGTDKPWKVFMGDWIMDEVARALGIEYGYDADRCCYVLAKVSKTVRAVQMDNLNYGAPVKIYVKNALQNLNVSNPEEIRQFMKSYGTHYINSYMTGDAIYQVFTYKKLAYKMLKQRMRRRNASAKLSLDDLRFYFSSYFLRQVGNVMVASGNKTLEKWARRNLRDSQYLYSRPSVLKLYYNPILAYKLKNSLDDAALLGLDLKILTPIFNSPADAFKYTEMVENDLKLWEVNA
ncbi:Torso-like protein [Eumeta japonica]|uniref:Torso-like protein n=1 Tax=Eumeta variegata TaxID=151549 RepID=A0A4C1Y6X8_EUMVA|nr:Torso-like protein [Eumeta japonica]